MDMACDCAWIFYVNMSIGRFVVRCASSESKGWMVNFLNYFSILRHSCSVFFCVTSVFLFYRKCMSVIFTKSKEYMIWIHEYKIVCGHYKYFHCTTNNMTRACLRLRAICLCVRYPVSTVAQTLYVAILILTLLVWKTRTLCSSNGTSHKL